MRNSAEFAQIVVEHLVDVSGGVCSVTATTLSEEPDANVREVLAGIQILHEDLEFHKAELRRSMEALSASESFNRAVLDHAGDGVVALDLPGNIRTWNRAAHSLFGYTADEVLGRSVDLVMPGAIERSDTGDRPPASRRETTGRHKDGHTFPVETIVSAALTGGEPLLVCLVRDLTASKQAEADVRDLHRRLVDASRHAGMAEVATGVLHNVGNVLNSVNVSTGLLRERLANFEVGALAKLAALVARHEGDLGDFIAYDPRGRRVPAFLTGLAAQMTAQHDALLSEVDSLRHHVEHVNQVVAMQQAYARPVGAMEMTRLSAIVDDALAMSQEQFAQSGVCVVREYGDVPALLLDRHKALLIVVNLVRNARHAVCDAVRSDRWVRVGIVQGDDDRVRVEVSDNGVGIRHEDLPRLFQQGFTTRVNGHGYGLHTSAIAARELGGTITTRSGGAGQGATFTLELPLAKEPRL